MTLTFEVDDERVEANPDATLTAEMAITMSVVRFMNDGLPPILVPSHSVLRIIVVTHNVAASLLLSSLLHCGEVMGMDCVEAGERRRTSGRRSCGWKQGKICK